MLESTLRKDKELAGLMSGFEWKEGLTLSRHGKAPARLFHQAASEWAAAFASPTASTTR